MGSHQCLQGACAQSICTLLSPGPPTVPQLCFSFPLAAQFIYQILSQGPEEMPVVSAWVRASTSSGGKAPIGLIRQPPNNTQGQM